MKKPTRYTYLVTIEQLPWAGDDELDFGSPQAWGELLKKFLSERLSLAEVVEVKSTRTRK